MIDVRKSVILALFAVICNAVQAQSIKGCVTDGIQEGDEEIVDELLKTLRKLMK